MQIANTTANLSAKTVLAAENADTITGLKTFDRDPNPPFAVTALSAVVPNLDADKLDGEHASAIHDAANLTGDIALARLAGLAFSSYTPTWSGTLGNGTLSGEQIQIGKLVLFDITLTWGSTSSHTATAQTFALPAIAAVSGRASGSAIMIDSGTAVYTGVGQLASTTALTVYNSDGAQAGSISDTAPFTWTTNDSINISGWYVAA